MRHKLSILICIVLFAPSIAGPTPPALAQGTWATKAPMPTARGGFAVGVVDGKVYAVGGQTSTGQVGTLEVYDPATDTWTAKSPMPTGRGDGPRAAVVSGILYVMGGCTTTDCSGLTNEVDAYNPATDTWTTKAPMPTARRAFGVGVINGVIYAVGGLQGPASSGISVNEAYDPMSNTWTTKSPMPTARGVLGAAVFNGKLYAIGGFTGYAATFTSFSTVEAYDPSTNSWTTRTSAPELYVSGADTVNGTIYVPGAGPRNDDLLAYDPVADTWSFQPPLPTPAQINQPADSNGVLYVVGGDATGTLNQAFTGPSTGPASTSTVLASYNNPALVNQSVTFTATVTSTSSTPTGSVTFADTSTSATLCSNVSLDSSGQATCLTSSLAVGTHTIKAQYNPNTAAFLGSSGTATEQIEYGICALYDQARSVKSGAAYPIKLYLCDANGADVSSSSVVVHATSIVSLSGFTGTVDDTGNANPDNDFRFDSTLGPSGGYIFNLSTKGLASGTYSLLFTAGSDPITHSLNFGVK